jgi:hypothetical protein
MIAYEFYRCDRLKAPHLIAILPERRKKTDRITDESVIKWGKHLLSDREDFNTIFFIKVRIIECEDEKRPEDFIEENQPYG